MTPESVVFWLFFLHKHYSFHTGNFYVCESTALEPVSLNPFLSLANMELALVRHFNREFCLPKSSSDGLWAGAQSSADSTAAAPLADCLW